MARGQRLSDAERAQIAAEKLTGDAGAYVAARHGVSRQTVHAAQRAALTETKTVNVEARMVDYLDAAFDTLIAQVRSQGDPDWLRQQDAQALGIAHGILFDKIVRVLRAIHRSNDAESGGDGPGTG